MIIVENLHKSYGEVQALNNVSFSIPKGEIIGLLGPNGAGKTTLIKILTGYLQPDSGGVEIDGLDVLQNPQVVQSIIGYLPENAPLYPELSVQSYLMMIAALREIPANQRLAHISEAIYAVRLQDYRNRPIAHLSKGYRQRVGLAQAILHRPRLLILDEPTIGLDPTQIVQIRNLIKQLAQTSTVLFSTHILPEAEALCDRAIIIMNGKLRADARLEDLANTTATILVLEKGAPDAAPALKAVPEVNQVETFSTPDGFPAYRVIGTSGSMNTQVYQTAKEASWPVQELRQDVRTLEAVFNELALVA
jgi:ABC-2 type transport system ATP-binding protein